MRVALSLALTLALGGCGLFKSSAIANVGIGLDAPTRSYAQAAVSHRGAIYSFQDLTAEFLIPPREAAATHKALTATGAFLAAFKAEEGGTADPQLQSVLLKKANTELDKATGILGPIEAERQQTQGPPLLAPAGVPQ